MVLLECFYEIGLLGILEPILCSHLVFLLCNSAALLYRIRK